MKRLKGNLIVALIGVLLVGAIAAVMLTHDANPARTAAKQTSSPVDDSLAQTARRMAAVADTADQQDLAHEAVRLADLEFDAAFASALREAAMAGPPKSGPLKQTADRIAEIKARMAKRQTFIANLTKAANPDDTRLELAKAQLALDRTNSTRPRKISPARAAIGKRP